MQQCRIKNYYFKSSPAFWNFEQGYYFAKFSGGRGGGCWGKKLKLKVWGKKMNKKGKGEREKGEKRLKKRIFKG